MVGPELFTGIYVDDVPATAKIFQDALDANLRELQPDLIEVDLGKGRLLLNDATMRELEATNPAPNPANDASETQLEVGIWVKDLEGVHQRIEEIKDDKDTSLITYLSDIEKKHSGIKDFRFRLPEGYYVRVTAAAQDAA